MSPRDKIGRIAKKVVRLIFFEKIERIAQPVREIKNEASGARFISI